MGNKMIDIEGISAVTMFVSKMDRAVDFYEPLGFKVCCGGRGELVPGEMVILQQYQKVSCCCFPRWILPSDNMKDVIYLLFHLLVKMAKLLRPGRGRAIISENLLLK
jgi:hypothetical protein